MGFLVIRQLVPRFTALSHFLLVSHGGVSLHFLHHILAVGNVGTNLARHPICFLLGGLCILFILLLGIRGVNAWFTTILGGLIG